MQGQGQESKAEEVRLRGEAREADVKRRLDAQEKKNTIAADIAERYGIIIPWHIRMGATSNDLLDIRGILHDALQRFEAQSKDKSSDTIRIECLQGGGYIVHPADKDQDTHA